ncbi:MAG: hypothetical protein ACREDD_02935 [Methylocella sp.]
MKNPYPRLIRKLDHPPAGPNWVRFVHHDPVKSAKSILEWIFGRPKFTYKPGYKAIKDRIELGIDHNTAMRIAIGTGPFAGREHNKSLIDAFFNYDAQRQYRCQNPIEFEPEYFRVSRDIIVPVAPLSIIRENGRFLPIFICGWNALSLSLFQRRLLMTVYEDAFLSLTDFQDSAAEIVFFPKRLLDDGVRREAEVWNRGDYELLSRASLNEAIETFLLARDSALQIISERSNQWSNQADGEDSPESGPPF